MVFFCDGLVEARRRGALVNPNQTESEESEGERFCWDGMPLPPARRPTHIRAQLSDHDAIEPNAPTHTTLQGDAPGLAWSGSIPAAHNRKERCFDGG